MLVVGLTGGIASGKTTVAELFEHRGVPVIDADIAARQVVAVGSEGLRRLKQAFGPQILAADGSLDRAALRRHVFATPAERQRLEAILHPLIRAELVASLGRVSAPYALLVAPLLLEARLTDLVSRVLVIDVPEEVQIQRVMLRDGSDRGQAEAILAAQMSRAERLAQADDVILNEDNSAALEPHRQI
jgi:dephospho-CoA kinase